MAGARKSKNNTYQPKGNGVARFQHLFMEYPVALVELDLTALFAYLDALRSSGIRDVRAYFNQHPDEIIRCLRMTTALAMNKALLELFEAPDRKDLIEALSTVFTEKSHEALREIVVALAAGGRAFDAETVAHTLRGKKLDVLLKGNLISGTEDGLARALITIFDITERRQFEKKLKESEEKYRILVDTADDAIILTDLQGNHLFANSAYYTSLGYAIGADPNPDGFSNLHPEDAVVMKNKMRELIDMGKLKTVYRVRHKDGSWRYRSALSTLIRDNAGNPHMVLAICRDITKRKETDMLLQQQQVQLREAQRISHVGSWERDLSTNVINLSDELMRIFGSSPLEKEFNFQMLLDLMHPDDREPLQKSVRDAILGKKPYSIEYRIVRGDGSTRIIHARGEAQYDDSGKPLIFRGTAHDITERKQAEDARLESESRYKDLFETSRDGIAVTDLSGRFLDCNRAYLDLLGYDTVDQVRLRSYEEITPPEYHAFEADIIARQTLARGWSDEYEKEYIRRTGERVAVSLRAWLRRNAHGQPSGMWAIVRDITERKQVEKALREATELFNLFMRHSPIYAFIKEVTPSESRVLQASDNYDQMIGIAGPQMLGKTMAELFPPEFAAKITADDWAVISHGEVLKLEEKLNGRTYTTIKFPLVQGERTLLAGYTIDITESKRANKELRENKKFLETVFEAAPTCVKLIDSDGTLQRMNRAGLDMIEADTLDQVRGQSMYPLVSDEHREAFQALVHDIFEGRSRTLEFEIIGLKGKPCRLYTQAVPLCNDRGEIVSMLAVTIDITERKKTEEALKESEQKFRNLAEESPNMIFINKKGRVVYANTRCEDITGYSRDELYTPGFDFMRLIAPEHRDQIKRNLQKHMSGEEIQPYEYSLITKSGTRIESIITTKLIDFEGEQAILGIITDITERKRMEEALRKDEEFIRNILNSVDEAFIVIDRDYRIITANKAYCLTVSCDDVIGKHCYEISHKRNLPCYDAGEECAVRTVFETGRPHASVHTHKDDEGRIIHVETKAFPIKDGSGNIISAIETINNITEKLLLEDERLKTQKLEAIGTLAGGIAHDFNNLLQGVFGYISLAKLSADQKEKSIAALEQAEKALHLSVNLTSQLLTFSKGGKPIKQRTDLRQMIENAARFALSGSRSDYLLDISDDLWAADAESGQIGQVVQNIVLNADQAMPEGGHVEISAKNIEAPARDLPQGLKDGRYVKISIKDNGVGIPQQYLAKIFDPYFTTKEKGSGLGLATSYSIVKNHSGLIEVQSLPGKGSTFVIYIPAAATVETKPIVADATRPACKGRILVMDDDEVVRMVAGELIRALGHDVDFAEHGDAAIIKYKTAREAGVPYDIVIMDITVRGGMGGVETIQKLREIYPDVKAIVSSGYSDNFMAAEYKKIGFRSFLKKPYNIEELRDMLNALLA